MSQRRVAITGLGVVSPLGLGIQEVFDALMARRCAIKPIGLFDASTFPCRIGGQLDNFSAGKFVPKSYRKAVKVMARDIEIAVAAADLCVRDSGIVTKGIDEANPTIAPDRLGCNIGAGLICVDLDELASAVNTAVTDGRFDFAKWGREGMKNLTPLWLLKYLPNMLSCHVTIIHAAKGPSNTITCGEAGGYLSVGEACRQIARGACDAAIAGGAESKLNPMGVLRQTLLGRLNTGANDHPASACRPFDSAHAGGVVGEGGGLLMLEELGRAQQRGARIYAEVAGFGAACDPHGCDYLKPTAAGLDRAITSAMSDADIRPDQIDLVIPNGTAVPAEDRLEAQALHKALGPRAESVAVVPLAGGSGNLFAASGAVNLAVAAMAVHKGLVPPAINCDRPDEACRLSVPSQSINQTINYALCGGFAIGGQSGAVVLKRYPA
jgi:3-oxoacyl-[acyl-carrier-protein] synthase II